jgi:microcystin-dependent protein
MALIKPGKDTINVSSLNTVYYPQTSINVGAGVPTGVIWPFARNTSPTGWMICSGEAISRTTYAQLFSVIGTTYGIGDGTTTFNIPNTQGVSLKGAGSQNINGRSKDAGSLGQVLEDQSQGFGLKFTVDGEPSNNTTSPAPYWGNVTRRNPLSTSFEIDSIPTRISDGSNGTPRSGNATRDSSLAVNYIIKYQK